MNQYISKYEDLNICESVRKVNHYSPIQHQLLCQGKEKKFDVLNRVKGLEIIAEIEILKTILHYPRLVEKENDEELQK